MVEKQLIEVSNRVLILEISHKQHAEEMKELKSESRELSIAIRDLTASNLQIRNVAAGAFMFLVLNTIGVTGAIKAFFM